MSTVKTNNVQIGQSVTATNNFTWYQPASPDGTVRLGNGNSGSVSDVITVGTTGNLTFANSVSLSAASTKTLTLNGGAGSNGLVLDASNNVGIGTTTATGFTKTIRLNAASGTAGLLLCDADTDRAGFYIDAGTAAPAYVFTNNSKPLVFSVAGSERARIDSSGNLLVGDTSNSRSARAYFTTSSGSDTLDVYNTNASFNSVLIFGSATRAASTAYDFLYMAANGVAQFRVNGAGTIYAINTTVQSVSDVRLKENIRSSTDGLSVINALRPVRFDWKLGYGNGKQNQLGFIAQEVEEVFPEAVDEWTKVKENDDETYKTVGPSALIPVLVKAIQELSAELNLLKAKVNS